MGGGWISYNLVKVSRSEYNYTRQCALRHFSERDKNMSPLGVDRTGPPQKTAVQLAAGGGHLEVLEELARYTTQADWLVRQAVSSPVHIFTQIKIQSHVKNSMF